MWLAALPRSDVVPKFRAITAFVSPPMTRPKVAGVTLALRSPTLSVYSETLYTGSPALIRAETAFRPAPLRRVYTEKRI